MAYLTLKYFGLTIELDEIDFDWSKDYEWMISDGLVVRFNNQKIKIKLVDEILKRMGIRNKEVKFLDGNRCNYKRNNLVKMVKWRIKLLRPTSVAPTKAYDSDAGWDVYADIDDEIIIRPFETKMIPLGFKAELEPGYMAIMDDRSSIGYRSMTHLAGVIDSGFRGEYKMLLHNLDYLETKIIKPRAKIGQILILPVPLVEMNVIEWGNDLELNDSERGEKMLGSSD